MPHPLKNRDLGKLTPRQAEKLASLIAGLQRKVNELDAFLYRVCPHSSNTKPGKYNTGSTTCHWCGCGFMEGKPVDEDEARTQALMFKSLHRL
jgi:hypothetical protein